jgi:membrane-bound serine protease (ClpP class)
VTRRRRVLACGVSLALALLAPPAGAASKPPGLGRVLVTRLEGPVSPISAGALSSALARAERGHYEALVLEVDTPGGLETSMRDMVKDLLAAKVPVIAWVTPGGARAASAGVFVVMAADVAAMSPGTNIGAATPINMQGGMDSTLARKVTNDAAAFARTIAAQRGRNIAWAERAVREAVAVDETEAVQLRIVDFLAGSLEDLLAKSEGRAWTRNGLAKTLHVRGLPVDRVEPGFRQRLLALVADPNVAYILMMLGFYGMLFELQNPGSVLPGVVGGICLILAFLAFSVLPVNYAGVALIVLGIVFFIAEIKVASHGVLTAGGILALVLGSIVLFDTRGTGLHVSWGVIAGATLATAAFFLVVIAAGLRAQRRRVATGRAGLIGARAVTVEKLSPEGRVRLEGEIWNAVADRTVEVGDEVEIAGVDGLTLRVRALAKEALV